MGTIISRSAEETLALGRAWGEAAQPGWIVGLTGELGAGKTQLVKGIAVGLGVAARVRSPTFAIVNCYPGGRLMLTHLDLYRLATEAELRSAGLEEYFVQPEGVVVVEWFERWTDHRFPLNAANVRRVTIEALGADERRITYEDTGA